MQGTFRGVASKFCFADKGLHVEESILDSINSSGDVFSYTAAGETGRRTENPVDGRPDGFGIEIVVGDFREYGGRGLAFGHAGSASVLDLHFEKKVESNGAVVGDGRL